MSSPGQRRGVCGHLMAGFDKHMHCTHCDVLTEDQKVQLSTASYQKKKEKQEEKNSDKNSENVTEMLVDPALFSV